MKCVKIVNYSININGDDIEPFKKTKGLRKSEPISPYFFAITMEYLSKNLTTLKDDQKYKFHPMCHRLKLAHLSFVDKLLLFTRDEKSMHELSRKFTNFSKAFGLQASLNKSSIYFSGVSLLAVKDRITKMLGIE